LTPSVARYRDGRHGANLSTILCHTVRNTGAGTNQRFALHSAAHLARRRCDPAFSPGSSYLKSERVRETEQYNMSRAVPGRIGSIGNIHNPSIEFHPVEANLNTGATIILVAGGGHNTLNVGSESADFVPFF